MNGGPTTILTKLLMELRLKPLKKLNQWQCTSQIIVSYNHFQKVTNINRTYVTDYVPGVEDKIEGKIVKKNVDTLG